jgi:translation initiation factor 3 subunit M
MHYTFLGSSSQAFHGLRLNQQWSHLVQLLKIICDGSLEDFLTFKNTHRASLLDNKLDESALEQNIRLLTISSLAANSSNRLVSFQSISAALKVPEDEVEMWVIEAIAHNLINGSIDQVNSTVAVT